MKPLVVLAVALLLSRSAGAADTKEPTRMDMAKAFRDCALVEKIDVPHGGKLLDAGKVGARSCMALGIAYERGDTVDVDGRPIETNYKLALRYYVSACGAEIAIGCVSVGQLLEKGRTEPSKGVSVLSAASKWYALGCNLPNSDEVRTACFLAGQANFKNATGKKKTHVRDLAPAMKFFGRGCELGDDDSCKLIVQVQEALSKP